MVGDAKQLDAVDAGKPFAQLQAAGMQTATMDEIMRQRDPALKEAVEASLKGDIARAFDKLGSNVAEVKPDNIAGAVAARWLRLDADARENTGVMAPSHELRQAINGHIRERLAREGRIHGPAMESERLVSKGYTNAEKALAGNYAAGDVVAFHRPYKRIGVEKGDERRVIGVDHKARAVLLDDGKGGRVAWKPEEIGGRRGGSEVYRPKRSSCAPATASAGPATMPASAWSTAARPRSFQGRERARDVPPGGRQDARTRAKDRPAAAPSRPCLGLDRARLPGPHGGQRDRGDGGAPSASHHAEELLCRDQPGARPRRAGHRRCGRAPRPAPGRHRRAHRGARRHRRDEARGPGQGGRGRTGPSRVRPERGPGEGAGKARENTKTPAKAPEPVVRERGKGGMDLGL